VPATNAVEIGHEAVRGVAATRCRLTVDLAWADPALPAGVSAPAAPYRALGRMPAEPVTAADTSGRSSNCGTSGANDNAEFKIAASVIHIQSDA
jgi:hypothetical protein